ncbi:mucin-5AC-like [Pelodytes ibericus]
MGTFTGVPLWILLVIIGPMHAQMQYNDYDVDETIDYTVDEHIPQQQQNTLVTGPPRVSIIQNVQTTPVVKAINTAHNGKICSTWGNFNFKNFDGHVFYFPGTCNYLYSSHCKSSYEDFNIQIRRAVVDNVPVIEKITMKLDGLVVQMGPNNVMVNGETEQLPFNGGGVQIEKHGEYLTLTSKLGLVFMWNDDDSLLLELDEKYANQTCGLCGDYNSISINSEFTANGVQITETQFGNLQKIDGPTELCLDVPPTPKSNCTDYENICEGILMGATFSNCHSLVGVEKYIEACVKDLCLCDSNVTSLCLCDTFSEYSRQCAHAGGQPQNWRTPDLCPRKCPYNMEYQECGSPCADTCSNPERGVLCENHCLEGCFCPPGTVFDDINNSGCVAIDKCSCTFNSDTYTAGASYSTDCSTCLCSGGKWKCQNMPCPASCSIQGGSHITTYDQTHYNIHGDCNYVLSKVCSGGGFTVLAELRKCGLTDSETCLKSSTIILNGGETIVVIKPCGSVYVNNIYTQLPVSAANVTIFRPSSFYIVVETNLGVQVVAQLIPFMQVYVILDPSFKTKTCGLCGNFNDKQADDFQTISGVVEGTAASFANTWKTQGDCPNVKNVYEDPCSLSVENEKYAQHWCGLISDPSGPFVDCHSQVNPDIYKENCMFDTCNCERSEDCMCAALSSYVHACAAKGIILTGWRSTVCSKYMNTCPKTLNYTYSVSTCQPTCRSLSEPDVTCDIKFVPVDGCTCSADYYMDDSGKCVPAAACPCYYRGSVVPSGEVVHDNGIQCTCTQGRLSCIGTLQPACSAPMVYFDCKNSSVSATGAECQKSCQTLDMECYRTKCVSGCVCPQGLVSDGKGGCVTEDECPCIHNDATYKPGEKIKMKCNTCTCKDRMWECTNDPCLGTCAVYGDGHYITFDGKRYSFNGDCEYTLAQDHCGQSGNSSSFRVITENIPCGTTGTTCSKAIKVFLGSYEIILTDEHIEVLQRGIGGEVPYKVRYMGIYLVIEADNGLILMWDRRTSIFIKLGKDFEGQVCGLCGNYDGDGNNDFTTRSMSVVGDVTEFGNSWKLSPTCPDAKDDRDACSTNPYRKAWAQKQCSIINSKAFSSCHAQVDPSKYYDACVTDSCACDTGGDCECFCTAVAAYAQACGETGICVSWRSPSICPLFCDYYNPEGECEWHYKPCGAPCLKTCRNPTGKCLHELSGLEGCYPSCPAAKPFFDEDDMECVAQCGCYDNEGKHYKVGSPVHTHENCQTCSCTLSGIACKYDNKACHCEYQGKMYNYNDVIYNTTDGIGGCITAICKENGTIYRNIYDCSTTTTTPFTFTTTPSTTRSATTTPITTTICVKKLCQWSKWFDVSYPEAGMANGDFDTFENIKSKGFSICNKPENIECRAERFPDTPLNELEQNVQCNASFGLICYNKEQLPPICYNYELRVECCSIVPCDTTPSTPETSSTVSTQTTTPTPTPTTEIPTTTTHPTTKQTTIITEPTTSATPSTTAIITTPQTTTSSATPSTTTACQPTCKWTPWLDVHVPGIGKKEGDFETYEKLREAGKSICKKPDGIQCRAEKYPDMPIGRIGQVVQCNLTIGLVCNNEEQEGDFKLCLNYQVKVLCCDDYSNCLPTTPETTTETTTASTTTVISTTTPETTTETTTASTTTVISTTTPETTTETTTASTTTVISTTTPSTTTETTTVSTTTPSTTTETLMTPSTTTETTTVSTTTPSTTTETTTVSTTTPSTTTETTTTPSTTTETTTVSTTTLSTTTETLTTPSTTTETTTVSTTTPSTTTETSTVSTTTPSTSTETTTVSTTTPSTTTETTTSPSTTTETTTVSTTTPSTTTETTTTPSTTTETTTVSTTTPSTTTETTTIPTTTPSTTTETTTVSTTTPSTTTTAESVVTEIFTTTPPPATGLVFTTTTTTSTTTPSTTPSTTTETSTPSTPITTTSCQPQCKWTTWIDVSSPTEGIDGGDIESYQNIIAKGKHICKSPQNIECRAEDFPGISIDNVGQVVQCDITHCTSTYYNSNPNNNHNYTFNYYRNNNSPNNNSFNYYRNNYHFHNSNTYNNNNNYTFNYHRNNNSPNHNSFHYYRNNYHFHNSNTYNNLNYHRNNNSPNHNSFYYYRNNYHFHNSNTYNNYTFNYHRNNNSPNNNSVYYYRNNYPHNYKTTTLPTTTPSTAITRTGCQPQCKWTTWIDVSSPTKGIDGGDIESYQDIISKGKHICKSPQNIECRAEDFPGISIDNIGQVVQCDITVGLVCNNKDQTGKVKQCYNYQIKVLCCDDYSHCSTAPQPTTTPTPTTITTTPSTTTETTTLPTTTLSTTTETTTTSTTPIPTTTSTTTETTTLPTTTPSTTTTETTTPSTTPIPTTTTTTPSTTTETTTLPTTTPSTTTETTTTSTTPIPTTTSTTTETTTLPTTTPSTTSCQPQCKWTTWIDVSSPTKGIDGGDIESYQDIISKGKHICKSPQNIECRAEDFPGISIDNIGQVVQCDITVGLVCNNKDQTGKVKQCYNYQIKVLCCDDYSHCSTAPQPTTTPTPTTITTTPSTTTETTKTTSLPTTTPSTTTETTTTSTTPIPTTTSTTTETTTLPTTTPSTSTETTTTSTTPIPTTTTTTPSTTTETTTLPTTTPSTTTETTTLTTTVPTTVSTTIPSTTTETTTLPTTSPSTAITRTGCQPQCKWTTWIDVSSPTKGIDGGDIESYQDIISKGKHICKSPQNIECRAEDFPGISIDNIGQVVQCDITVGLVCNNKDQTGKVKQCYNYQIKVLCCDDYSHCSTAPPPTTTPTPTTITTTPSTTTETTTLPTTTPSTTTETTTTSTTPIPTTTSTTTETTTLPTTTPSTTTETTTTSTTPIPTTTTTTLSTTTETTTLPTTTPSTTTETTTTSTTPIPTTTSTTTETTTLPTTTPSTTTTETTTTSTTPIPTTTTTTPSTTTETTTLPTTTPSTSTETTTTSTTPIPTTTTTTTPSTTTETTTLPTTTPSTTTETTTLTTTVPSTVSTTSPSTTTETTTLPTTTPSTTTETTTTSTTPIPTTTTTTPSTTTETTTLPTTTPSTTTETTTLTTSVPTTVSTTSPSTTTETTTLPTTTPSTTTETTTTSTTPIATTTSTTTETTTLPTTTPSTTTETTTPSTTPIPTTTTTTTPSTTTETTTLPTTTPSTTTETTTTSTTPIPTTTSTTTETTTLPTTTPSTSTETTTVSTTTPSTTTETTTTTEPTTSTVQTTACQPNCRWSVWYDVDRPSSGIKGGDSETYKDIILQGKSICKKPSQIECRAVNYPDVSIDKIGQNVQCDVNFGLICKNEEQDGELKMCYNYEIRVRCCDDYSHCEKSSPTTSPTTSETTASQKTATTEGTPTTTPSTISQTTRCYCHVDETLYLPGDVIYNKTDEAGCHFYAICNNQCKPDRFQGPCRSTTTTATTTPTTTTTTTPTTTPTTATTTTSVPTTRTSQTSTTVTSKTPVPTTKTEGCPPKHTNETWLINNCTVATCHGNNIVTIEPVKCPEVKQVTCANGFPPVKVYSPDGCCYHYECECVCSGWGDPHYITFDGTYYTFLDNCTYVLVQQITPKYDNFRVLVDNYFCDAEDGLSCPQSILIYYKSNEVVLTRTLYNGRMQNRIRFNKNWITPGFTKNGITVTSAGINMVVEIPEIKAYISFSGMIFVIKVPFSLFGYNTEGQCGTCSNNSTEDCRLPTGKVIADCSQMANHWKVNVTDKPYCNVPPPPSTPAPPTPPPHCPSTPLCDVILSEIFADCHKKIPPKPYHEGCVFDACRIRNDSIQCSSLEIYAALCTANGVCVDWRTKTGGHCPYNCPVGKEYNPCGPVHPATCENKQVPNLTNGLTEGCYCPSGTKLFNPFTDVCVKSCSCVGPDGMPKSPAETWTSNCQQCVCEATSLTVQCTPLKCSEPAAISCDKEGYIIVQLPDPKQPCCMQNECRCNSSYCSNEVKSCPLGFETVPVLLEGDCCPTYDCKPMEVCVIHEAIYKPGHSIPQTRDSCEECMCTDEKDVRTMLNLITCDPIICKTDCSTGYKYKKANDQCCGICEQVACTMKMDDNTTVTIQPGETLNRPEDKCSYYECNKTDEHFVTISITKECSVINEDECTHGYKYKKVEGECCGTCEQVACTMKLNDNTTKVLKPEEVWTPPNEVCIYYECHIIEDQFVPVTVKRTCPIDDCDAGYEYKVKSGECCGECVKVACSMKMDDNTTKILKPGEVYFPPDQKCVSYTCTDTYDVVTVKEKCPAFDPTQCLEGSIKMSENGCCKTCEPIVVGCQVRKQSTRIKTRSCESDQTVELAYCEGGCKTTSMYSAEANVMEHKCSCCQEMKTSKREVSLKCLDGTSTVYSYIYVEQCGCTRTECDKDSQTSSASSQHHEDESTGQESEHSQQQQQSQETSKETDQSQQQQQSQESSKATDQDQQMAN